MSNSKRWTLIINTIILGMCSAWWWQSKGFDAFIAMFTAFSSILFLVFFENIFEKPNRYELLDRYPDLTEEFKTAVSFKMIGTNYQSFATRYSNSILDILRRKGTMQFIGSEPTLNVLKDLTNRSHSSANMSVMKSKIENFILTLKGLDKNYPSKIELKLLPYPSPYGLIRIDKIDEGSKIYFKPYTFKGEGLNPVLIFDKKKDQYWYDYFNSQFDKMWDSVSVKTIG